jgi:hypothetical protein
MYSFELHIQPTQWYNLLHDILDNFSLDNINRWQFIWIRYFYLCLSRNCSRKRDRFPTTIVEYGEKEVRDLLALERPKKKKDISKVMCFNCKELGYYVSKCPERNRKANRQGSMKKDLSLNTGCKSNRKGHYASKCAEKSTSRLQWTGITEGCRNYEEKTQQGVANLRNCMHHLLCSECWKDM